MPSTLTLLSSTIGDGRRLQNEPRLRPSTETYARRALSPTFFAHPPAHDQRLHPSLSKVIIILEQEGQVSIQIGTGLLLNVNESETFFLTRSSLCWDFLLYLDAVVNG